MISDSGLLFWATLYTWVDSDVILSVIVVAAMLEVYYAAAVQRRQLSFRMLANCFFADCTPAE